MNKFVMLVGLPASGKSKMATRYKEKGYVVHSSDAIREELYGDSQIQRNHNKIFSTLHQRVKKDLTTGYDVIYDATNISAKRRVQFLKELKDIECHKTALVMATPYNNCVKNDNLRANSVGWQVIFKMLKSWQLPCYNEGWDEIELKYWYDIDYDFYFDLHKRSFEVNQCNEHHTLSVGNHMEKVARLILNDESLNDEDSELLYDVALYHDLGKIIVQNFVNAKGVIKQNCNFYSHENISSYFGMFVFHDISKVIDICNIIQYHMKPLLLTTNKSIERMIDIVGVDMWWKIVKFNTYDKRGK